VASIEVPLGAWDGLIPSLLDEVKNNNSLTLKEAILRCLGFISEDLV
jgi:hypothetical protein